ncbi:MAG: helix-turn-helix domain-containing protein [Mycobacterium sp.]
MGAEFLTATPHPSLRGVVLRYEGYREKSTHPVVFRELPCSFVPIIIDLDAGWTINDALRLHSFIAGITDSLVLVRHEGSARCLQVDLTPLGARRLLGLPMHELANRTIAIEDVLGAAAHRLIQRIGDAPDWPTRFSLVDQAIRTRLADSPAIDAGLAWSLDRITAGASSIGALAVELGWSHRRMIARYRDAVGLPPKTVARIVRFERLTARLADSPAVGWATLAAECGFFDQAHLSREVRDLAGQTPTELRASKVNFVQDEVLVSP